MDASIDHHVLNDLGIAALEAEDGLEAQCLAKEHPGLKLVITDFTIPHINGIELAAWLKTNRAEVKVLLISSSPDHIITFGIPPTSAFAFLAKPFTTADLTSKVRSIL